MLILSPTYCSIYLGVSGTVSKLPGLLIRLSAGSSDIAKTMALSSYVTTGETLALEHKRTSTSLYPDTGIGILYMNVLMLLFGEGYSS